jgi:hypothetical protein
LAGALALVGAACGGPVDEIADTVPVDLDASEVLQRAIAFHDPGGRWSEIELRLELEESRPDVAEPRRTSLRFDNASGTFEVHQLRSDGFEIEFLVDGDRLTMARLDGSSSFSEQEADLFRLTPEQALRARDYYLYLYGLPMKLTDPGTRLDPQVERGTFFGEEAVELRVTYDPEVGDEVWYFYFDPTSYRMIGYRFYHDEAMGDGEYILTNGLAQTQGLRLPQTRRWYTHQEHRLLGTDTIVDR